MITRLKYKLTLISMEKRSKLLRRVLVVFFIRENKLSKEVHQMCLVTKVKH